MSDLSIRLSPDVVDAIAQRAAAIVLDQLHAQRDRTPWLYGAKAAGHYLGWSEQKVYKRIGELPHHRIGQRLAFRTADLDHYLEDHRE